MTRKDTDVSDFDGLAAPARRALASAGHESLADLAHVTEVAVAGLHGMGPRALDLLRARLADRGLSFSR